MRISGVFLLAILAGVSIDSHAQTALTYSGCEAPPEVRAAYNGTLSQDSLVKLKLKERDALQRQVIGDLLAKYPREYSLYVQQMNLVQYSSQPDAKAAFDALRDRWVKNAHEHPDDALALLLAGKILDGKDMPEVIRLMEAAKAKAPNFPWPAHELTTIYWRGKFADEAKMKENLESFYSLCPTWTVSNSYEIQVENFRLQKDLPLVAKTAVALRAALEIETDPKRLEDYQILWQREFLTRPPSEHAALRAQIKQDLKRLETLVPNGDVEWRSFLIAGYKLSGASNEELDLMQDAVARDFPHSGVAESKLWKQFNKEHPRPDGQKDAAAWKAYESANVEVIKKIIRDFPDDVFAQRSEFFTIAREDEYISKEDGLAALDRYIKANDEYGGLGILSFGPSYLSGFLLDHGWEPERALEILKGTSTYKDGGHTKVDWQSDISEKDLKRFKKFQAREDREIIGMILKAAALAGKPDEALKFRAAVEEAPPEDEGALEQYWTNRAHFAALDKRPLDALVYYRLALDNRREAPEYHQGILRDDLTTDFHALWTAQGGTEAAWAAWNPPASAEAAKPAPEKGTNAAPTAGSAADAKKAAAKQPESDWKPVETKMPSFELSDFAGKTWRQKDLQGKVVLIVSWATWCGPCRMQDLQLQKFYEKVKDRKDLVILSFNVDENPGEVLPFMQQQKYTFPVLAAFSYSEEIKHFVPRAWIIDAKGNWRWVKNGYDEAKTYAEFEKEMLDQIEKAKTVQ
jgi:thiol-disulfide isomerase/thioredoxin